MTVTISRLYDSYADAQRAVSNLEAAGVPHSDLASWPTTPIVGIAPTTRRSLTRRSIATVMESMIVPKEQLQEQGSVRVPAVRLACSPVWVCWRSRGWVRSSQPDGLRLPRSVRQPAPPQAVLSALCHRQGLQEEAPLYAEGVRRGGTLVSARVPDADRDASKPF